MVGRHACATAQREALTSLCVNQMENTPTYGSIDTTDAEKRRIARQSLEFNLKIKAFREYFPHLCEASASTSSSTTTTVSFTRLPSVSVLSLEHSTDRSLNPQTPADAATKNDQSKESTTDTAAAAAASDGQEQKPPPRRVLRALSMVMIQLTIFAALVAICVYWLRM